MYSQFTNSCLLGRYLPKVPGTFMKKSVGIKIGTRSRFNFFIDLNLQTYVERSTSGPGRAPVSGPSRAEGCSRRRATSPPALRAHALYKYPVAGAARSFDSCASAAHRVSTPHRTAPHSAAKLRTVDVTLTVHHA